MFRDGHGCAITTAQGTWASQGQRNSPATLSHPPQHAEHALTTTTTSELMESRGSLACRGCQRVETGPRCPPASRRRPSPRVVSFAPSGGLVLSSDSAHPKHRRRLVRQRPRCNARDSSPGPPWAARAFVVRSMSSDISSVPPATAASGNAQCRRRREAADRRAAAAHPARVPPAESSSPLRQSHDGDQHSLYSGDAPAANRSLGHRHQ